MDPFPDGLLEKLSDQGVTGVWLHVVLRQLAPGGPYFPEFGEGHEQRITNLQRLVKRAQRYGIDIYLYMNEPRSQPFAFFEERPNMAGLIVGERKLMCTSVPEVRDWIRDALTYVFRQVPNLGGVFTITASENPTNCAYRGGHRDCPRCGKRSDTDILVEVNQAIAEGRILNVDGAPVNEPLQDGLLREDGKILYPVRDAIPVMLIGEGIPMDQLV